MGLRHLRCWTNYHFIKKIEIFEGKHDFPECGFFEFSKISIFGKVTLEPLKKIWDLYQSIRLEKSVSKMGFLHLICWTNDHFIKKHWNFDEIFDFRGCGFSKFSKISIFGLLTIASYTVFCGDFHCGNEELIRRSKWWFMTKLHFFYNFF